MGESNQISLRKLLAHIFIAHHRIVSTVVSIVPMKCCVSRQKQLLLQTELPGYVRIVLVLIEFLFLMLVEAFFIGREINEMEKQWWVWIWHGEFWIWDNLGNWILERGLRIGLSRLLALPFLTVIQIIRRDINSINRSVTYQRQMMLHYIPALGAFMYLFEFYQYMTCASNHSKQGEMHVVKSSKQISSSQINPSDIAKSSEFAQPNEQQCAQTLPSSTVIMCKPKPADKVLPGPNIKDNEHDISIQINLEKRTTTSPYSIGCNSIDTQSCLHKNTTPTQNTEASKKFEENTPTFDDVEALSGGETAPQALKMRLQAYIVFLERLHRTSYSDDGDFLSSSKNRICKTLLVKKFRELEWSIIQKDKTVIKLKQTLFVLAAFILGICVCLPSFLIVMFAFSFDEKVTREWTKEVAKDTALRIFCTEPLFIFFEVLVAWCVYKSFRCCCKGSDKVEDAWENLKKIGVSNMARRLSLISNKGTLDHIISRVKIDSGRSKADKVPKTFAGPRSNTLSKIADIPIFIGPRTWKRKQISKIRMPKQRQVPMRRRHRKVVPLDRPTTSEPLKPSCTPNPAMHLAADDTVEHHRRHSRAGTTLRLELTSCE